MCNTVFKSHSHADGRRVPPTQLERMRNSACGPSALCGALDLDDRQEPRVVGEADDELELRAWLDSRWGLRGRAPRLLRPLRSGLEAGTSIRGASAFVDLGRGSSVEPGVWPVLVVPVDVLGHRPAKALSAKWDLNPSQPLAFERAEESLDGRIGANGVLAPMCQGSCRTRMAS